jgi:hypothetical protein
MLFEPAMIDAFSHALARDVPAIVQPLSAGDEAQTFLAEQRRFLDQFEAETDRWIELGRKLREEIWSEIERSDHGNTTSISTIEHMISAVEQRQAEIRGEVGEWQRRWNRNLKLSRRISDAHYSGNREVGKRLFATIEKRFEERADFLLFLRAIRAEISPEARGGPTFDSPDDLDAFLRSALRP